jgi:molybdopterin converting factor small subunit
MTIRMSGILLRFIDYQGEQALEATTIGAAIDALVARFPALGPALLDDGGRLRAAFRVYHNGHMVERECADHALAPDDELEIHAALAGGRTWPAR